MGSFVRRSVEGAGGSRGAGQWAARTEQPYQLWGSDRHRPGTIDSGLQELTTASPSDMPILAYCLLLGVFYDTWRADKNIGSIFVIIHPSPDRLTPPCKVDNLQNANYTPPLPPPQPASITRQALSPDLWQTVHFSSDNRNKKQEIFQKTYICSIFLECHHLWSQVILSNKFPQRTKMYLPKSTTYTLLNYKYKVTHLKKL